MKNASLNFINIAGRGIYGAYFGQGTGPVVFGSVRCNGTESELLECNRNMPANCGHHKDVSVRCILTEDQRVKNMTVSANVVDTKTPSTVLISWVLYNITMDEPTSFDIECSNERHSIIISVSGQDSTTHLMGLFPLTFYNCCVSAVYELYRAEGVCDDEIETPELFVSATSTTANSDHDSDAKLVGGVLGFIVVICILSVLLIISGAALVFLLLPRWKGNGILAR